MSTAIVTQPHPMVAHPARRTAVKAAIFVTALTGASAALYAGAHALTAHYTQQPTGVVSYATPDTIARTLVGADHAPATAGDFQATANIQTADVVSVVKVAR